MQGNQASSPVDLGYPELFPIAALTTVSFWACEGVLGDALYFRQANQGSLHVWLGTWNSSAPNAVESGLISGRGGSLMGFLELPQEPEVYSSVTAGMAFRNSSLFSDVRTPV